MSSYLIHYSKGYEAEEHKYKAREYYGGRWHYYYDEDLLDDGDVTHYPVGEKSKNHDALPKVHTETGIKNTSLLDPITESIGDVIDNGKAFVKRKMASIKIDKNKTATNRSMK